MGSYTLFAFFIVCLMSHQANGQHSLPKLQDYTSIPGVEGLYKMHMSREEFSHAKATCESEGASLFYPDNESEAKTVISFWKNKIKDTFPSKLHLGMERIGDVFKTIHGMPISCVYNEWTSGEPNNQNGEESCVEIQFIADDWSINDIVCDDKKEFICEFRNKQCVMANLDVQPTDSRDHLQDYTFIPGTRSSYKLHKTPRQFNDAKAICEGEEASLFYPENENETNVVMSFWQNKEHELFPNELLVGIGKSTNGYTTIDDDFQDYGYVEELGRCYKFHVTPETWADAQEKCRAEHSYLAVINSHEEADYLVRLTKKVALDIPGNFKRGVVLLGFHNNSVEDWQTVQGTSLYSSGYACWGNGQPDGGDRQRCGSMYYNGHLNDIGCDQKGFFICEHNIEAFNYEFEPPSYYTIIQSLRCYDIV